MKDFRRPTSEMETKMGCQECSCKSKSGDFLTPSGYEKENEKMLDEPVRFDSEFLKIVSILGEEIYTMKNSVDKIELLIGHIDSRYIKDDKNEKSPATDSPDFVSMMSNIISRFKELNLKLEYQSDALRELVG